jgi:hypothetical protein
MKKKETNKTCKVDIMINPYSSKQDYEWNNMDAKDWFFSFGRFDNVEILANDKYKELNLIIIKYIGRWNKLSGQISGRDANLNISLSYAAHPQQWHCVQRLLFNDVNRYPDLQEQEKLIGCAYAADETYSAIIDKTYKYWNAALIKISGHYACAVYDNEIAQKETYVLDPWLTQRPDIYTWEDWPFKTKNGYNIVFETKKMCN